MVLQNPKIWLLDEPSASLDQESEQRLVVLLRELSRDKTIIFTSHQQRWLALSDRMMLLEDGAIKADAPAQKISMQQQATLQVAASAKSLPHSAAVNDRKSVV